MLKHLRMAAIAQRRDLSDPDLIHAFAEEVGTLDRLEKLYLLTYADIATVGPRTWTDWKARLLRELFEKTREVLLRGRAPARRPGPPRRPGASSSPRRCSSARGACGSTTTTASSRRCRRATSSPSRRGSRRATCALLSLGRRRALAAPPRRHRGPRPPEVALTAARPARPARHDRRRARRAPHRHPARRGLLLAARPGARLARRPGARRLRAARAGGGAGRARRAGAPPAPTWRACSRARSRSTR